MTTYGPQTIGSGYNPSAWCTNPACHAPIPAHETTCPECGADQAPLIQVAAPRDPLPLDILRNFGVGVLRIYRGNELIEQRLFATTRADNVSRELAREKYRAACELVGV